jgi:hypothetical protein
LDDLFDPQSLSIAGEDRSHTNPGADNHRLPAAAGRISFDVSVVKFWHECCPRISVCRPSILADGGRSHLEVDARST